ncbi:MAG TPA: septum formation initiator family protein [Bacillota bacterium]|nr:septum formation initiator family protein [Bacillota bacterium]
MYKVFLASSFIMVIMLLVLLGFQTVQRVKLKQQLLQYQDRIEEYENRNLATKYEIERLQEPGYIELLARKYLGLVKPGETIFQFED